MYYISTIHTSLLLLPEYEEDHGIRGELSSSIQNGNTMECHQTTTNHVLFDLCVHGCTRSKIKLMDRNIIMKLNLYMKYN